MVASFPIYAVDSSFAVATGSNVNSSAGRSSFDYPPNSSKDLVITTKDGDADPRLFELGDTYDLSWAGHGGGGMMTDAVVVRSDGAGENAGIIVFEGTSGGEQVQVIWTPQMDLENWYWSNFSSGNAPLFYNADQNPAYTHEFICFEKSARIHTPRGLIPAGQLETGQTVCTWAGRAREIRWIGRSTVPGDGAAAPVRFGIGAIGNFKPLKLSPQHRVLIAGPEVELQYGAPEVLVPAAALIDGQTVRQVTRREVEYVHILLETHDILIAEGAPCESLLPGWRTRDLLSVADRAAIRDILGAESRKPCRPILRRREAELLAPVRCVPRREEALI